MSVRRPRSCDARIQRRKHTAVPAGVMNKDTRKRNAEAGAKALRQAGEELGIGPLSAEDKAADLLLDRAADHLRERNIRVPMGGQGRSAST